MSEAPDPTAYADILLVVEARLLDRDRTRRVVVVMQAYERMRIIQDKTANIAAQLNALAEQQRKLYEENDVLAKEYKEMRKLLDQMREKYGDVVPPAR